MTTLAAEAAGLDRLYPDTGAPWQPSALYLATHPHSAAQALGAHLVREGRTMYSVADEWVTATVDVSPWLEQKIGAALAHRTEVARGALPGRLAAPPPTDRAELVSTEWYIRRDLVPTAATQTQLTPCR
ncbi:hypothetical protein ACFYOY_27415 [Streptomyces sp. NPDC007875]|uniref:hypothetical protein n=1 Tax=Streptomyces sp. NPDC007875 TaxID=3364783 RepID=UPI0036A65DB4